MDAVPAAPMYDVSGNDISANANSSQMLTREMPRAISVVAIITFRAAYLIPTTIHSRSVSCSTLVWLKPVSRIQPRQSAPV